ncbi:MAG: hypothetical protein U1C74_09160 [Phenylobacterium sp.]|nr:hypothetical protein [Phenylobacterium sp.]
MDDGTPPKAKFAIAPIIYIVMILIGLGGGMLLAVHGDQTFWTEGPKTTRDLAPAPPSR